MKWLKQHYKRIIYTLCFLMFCVVDQVNKNAFPTKFQGDFFRDLFGIVFGVLLIIRFKGPILKKCKIPFMVWAVAGAAMVVLGAQTGRNLVTFYNDWIIILADLWLYGFILIYMFVQVILFGERPKFNKAIMIILVGMTIFAVFSKSDLLWPFTYLVMFGSFYLTTEKKEEQEDFIHGMLDGMIICFLIFQGHCFLFRPYDAPRYVGFWANSNWNSLYLLEVLAAVFVKIFYVTKKNSKWWIKLYYWLGAGVVLSYEFMSIGRAGWLGALFLGLVFVWSMGKLQKKKKYIVNGIALVLVFAITFPACFAAARYLPPYFHHVIWFYGEYSEEKVHSWDPWDSEKFVDFDEFADAALGRIYKTLEEILKNSPLALKVLAAERTEEEIQDIAARWWLPVTDPRLQTAVITDWDQSEDGFLVRTTIYKHYLKNLNFWGHTQEDQGFQLTPRYWIGHAHNIFLQWGTDFGIPCLILFVLLNVIACKNLISRFCKKQDLASIAGLYYILIPLIFGMFEFCWGAVSITMVMYFIMLRFALINEESGKEEK